MNKTWQQQVLKIKEFHDKKLSEYASLGVKGKKAEWGMRETAEELHISVGLVCESIRLAEALIANPALGIIKDRKLAEKIVNEKNPKMDLFVAIKYVESVLEEYQDNRGANGADRDLRADEAFRLIKENLI